MEYPITDVFHSRLKQRFLGISILFPLHRLAIHCLKNPILPLPKFHLKNTLNRQPFHIPFDSGIPPIHPRSGETVSRSFHNVLNVVIRLQDVLFKKAEPITANSTDPMWKWFKNCLGALDGTHIKIRVPTVDKPRYRTRKVDIATNMLGVCTPDIHFVYVLPGWEGFVANGLNYQPSTSEEFFNMKHASARNVIERCFGFLKLRWGILRNPSFYPVRLKEGLPSNVIDDDEPNIVNIHSSDAWATWRMELANQMFDEWQASRN
ncbi:hypothetical protein CXB51_000897 [Gossypium anomalum]|uniref:DDE Tnp4 domain-containing protein n=1 Tax=Gossypium anomalum TaxID=47600 RepID=A0A8J5ZRK5_9ROSI|nr:hypothetical protein CXB51_000897 [Gossypium anomalum]